MSAERYWEQISFLRETYGIDYFFETGDAFPRALLRRLAGCVHPDVGFRVYACPGYFRGEDLDHLKSVGVDVVFMGVESVLHLGVAGDRRIAVDSPRALVREIKRFGEYGIRVWPGFLLGLPGESKQTLNQNVRMIYEVANLDNVDELTVSVPLPLPGSKYFEQCLGDNMLAVQYRHHTGDELATVEWPDPYLLSRLFIKRNTVVQYSEVDRIVDGLCAAFGKRLATWRENGSLGDPPDQCCETDTNSTERVQQVDSHPAGMELMGWR